MILPEPIRIAIISGMMSICVLLLLNQLPFGHHHNYYVVLPELKAKILYTVQEPDNYTAIFYKYNNLEQAARSVNMTDFDFFLKLRASPVYGLQCQAFEDPFHNTDKSQSFTAFACYIGKESYFFFLKPYHSFSKLDDFIQENCTKIMTQYDCKFDKIQLDL